MSQPPTDPHPLEQPRNRHPLEQPPSPRPQPTGQKVTLNIRSVRPLVTYTLIAINVVVFVLRTLSLTMDQDLLVWGVNNGALVFQQGEWYRLLSAMFLHSGIYAADGSFRLQSAAHILFNMWTLYAVGLSLERMFGHWRFLIVYLLGGLLGSILSAFLGGSDVFSVGASGAVFAILGAEFVFFYQHRKLMGAAGQERRRTLLIFLGMNFAVGLLSNLPGAAVSIDNWGHLGGLLGGVVLAWFISPVFNLRAHPERPQEFLAEDINPLRKNTWAVSIYATGLVVLVFVGSWLARG
jgi:rhomboid protease GluP